MSFNEYNETVKHAVGRFKERGYEPPRSLNQWRAIVQCADYVETTYCYEFFGKTFTFKEEGSFQRQLQDGDSMKKMESEFRKHARDFVTVTALADYPPRYREVLRNILMKYRFVIWRWDTYGEELQEWILSPKRGIVGEKREGLL